MLRSHRKIGALAVAASLSLFVGYTASSQTQEPTQQPGGRAYPVHFPTGSDKLDAADFFNNAIRMIDAGTGVISTVAGRIPTSAAEGHCC